MTTDYRLESLGWVFNILEHGKFDVAVAHDVGVGLILFLAFDRSLFVLKSRLVEVDVLAHDNRLNRHQDLQES